MAKEFFPLRSLQKEELFKAGDILVVFGEVFSRGYVNGLIEEAKAHGMKVIFSTVGRRDENDVLRPLTEQELSDKENPLINIPLEAGFDMEKDSHGQRPIDRVQGLKLSEWKNANLDEKELQFCAKKGAERFRSHTKDYLAKLELLIPPGRNVLFAHTMAGGVPRTKIVMPVMNRVFKGAGDRYASSQEFWESPLGRFSELNFTEVTANTFSHLIELSTPLREKIEKSGGQASYVAFGYHGTEILIKNEYRWQSYSPYLQGFAKVALEEIAERSQRAGIRACVFNAPEILTNSSSIFLGVEVALYPLLAALKREAPDHPYTLQVLKKCNTLLKPEFTIEDVIHVTDEYFSSDVIRNSSNLLNWPQHNSPDQMARMKEASQKILDMHLDQKALLTAELSEVVFKACGKAMWAEGAKPRKPVWWVGHDLVAKLATART
jgi:hypothetical protein